MSLYEAIEELDSEFKMVDIWITEENVNSHYEYILDLRN